MNNTSWYRVNDDLKLYRTVFETSDYDLSNESVKWCEEKMNQCKKSTHC